MNNGARNVTMSLPALLERFELREIAEALRLRPGVEVREDFRGGVLYFDLSLPIKIFREQR